MYDAYEGLDMGKRVLINNRSRLDHAFQGKTGTVVNPRTSNGFTRVHLDGEPETMTILVHPESLELTQ